jgi:NAD(P)-dependent dehydrogenase (short-subunit alcohol dehydrogenase family)
MTQEQAGRLIVITGGGSGIGRATAILCAKRGDRVAIMDKDEEGARSAAEEAHRAGADGALGLACDVSREEQVAESFARIRERLGVPYGVFANAGIDVGGMIHEMPLATWKHIVDTNLTGIFLTCKHALRQMLEAQVSGTIVCTSSPAGFIAMAAGACGAYSATKGAISSLVRCMAIDYARFGIRVNAVAPGATETGMMWNNVALEEREAMRDQLCREIPLGRLAKAEDPARIVAWMLSEETAYMTGSHVICDGGILAKGSSSV